MINTSKSWMAEAKSWLATPCSYTTSKCLSGHVHMLQVGLLKPSTPLSTRSPLVRVNIGRCVVDGVGRLGPDPIRAAGLRLRPEGDVSGLRRHGSPAAAGRSRPAGGRRPGGLRRSSGSPGPRRRCEGLFNLFFFSPYNSHGSLLHLTIELARFSLDPTIDLPRLSSRSNHRPSKVLF